MSETATETPPAPPAENSPAPEEVPHWKKPRQRVSQKTKVALLAVIESARYVKRVNLQAIAIRFGVKLSSLKQIWYRWNKGLVDLGEPETPEERSVETKVEMARTMMLVTRTEQFLNDQFESIMCLVRDAAAEGNKEAYFKFRVPEYVNALNQLARLRDTKEKGFLAMLDQANRDVQSLQRQSETPKQLSGPIIEVPGRVARASEDQQLERVFQEPA